MKNYFSFNLTGKKLFPVWLLMFVFYFVPYGFIQTKLRGFDNVQGQDPQEVLENFSSMAALFGAMIVVIIIGYSILFYWTKMTIEAVGFKEKVLVFAGKFRGYFGILISGALLSIITAGIYSPWFATRLCKFFARNTSHDAESIEFKGEGGDLFVIIACTLILPIILAVIISLSFSANRVLSGEYTQDTVAGIISIIMMIVTFIVFIPYIYYVYKWAVNLEFKNYSIRWETAFWDSAATIFGQIILSILTLGIYAPLASLKIYKYFAERTVARSETGSKSFGYDIEPGQDFLFIWGQCLLSIITIGFYSPWAYCKITERVLRKTYTEE